MRRLFFSKLEFWQQLVFFFSMGMVILALSTSVVLTITANNSLKSQITGQSLYLAESLARQARLSLLYESSEEAGEIVIAGKTLLATPAKKKQGQKDRRRPRGFEIAKREIATSDHQADTGQRAHKSKQRKRIEAE